MPHHAVIHRSDLIKAICIAFIPIIGGGLFGFIIVKLAKKGQHAGKNQNTGNKRPASG